ncbi:methyltransferase domain-containing protein [Rutstroemia sp. NJR-2017a BBW]|nr:methyltransferase domain-containing protein [Rutstroemia sp. NJR-2017a BBW]
MADVYKENMGRNELEAGRNIGYVLHPSVVSNLPPRPVIADIGTGTGKFLLHLAKSFPDATLHGFDISPSLFPAPQTLPSNMSLDIMDIKQPPHPNHENKYDFINVRLIAAGINQTEWDLVVRNISTLLKPGGSIQWVECNWADVQHIRGDVMSSVATARSMGSMFKEGLRDKFSHGWKLLPQLFLEQGFDNVEEDIVSSDRVVETRSDMTRNGMQAIFGWARLLSSRHAAGSLSMDNLAKLEAKAEQDIDSGCYVRFDIHVVLGFKPNKSR